MAESMYYREEGHVKKIGKINRTTIAMTSSRGDS
jgi:hypothetical protein